MCSDAKGGVEEMFGTIRSTVVAEKLETELIAASSVIYCGGAGAVIVFPLRRLLTGGQLRVFPAALND